MILAEDIQQYGAKGAVLRYIHETDPSIPIEPFVLVPVGEDWREHKGKIDELGNCLVRSSSPVEDGERLSFAGLFSTQSFNWELAVDHVLDSVKSPDVKRYAQIHGVSEQIQMALLFHKVSSSEDKWHMLRHPHRQKAIFMQRETDERSGLTIDLTFDEDTGNTYDAMFASRLFDRKDDFPSELEEALETYRKLEAMPAFQTGHTYHMEFGTEPFSVYQFRPFRKKETADWTLGDSRGDHLQTDLCFGITPPEGIELILKRALGDDYWRDFIKEIKENTDNLPYIKLVRKIAKEMNLSKEEMNYAWHLARELNPGIGGYADRAPFDRALEDMNRKSDKETTCLHQGDIHFYHRKPIDLVFPNAKVWVPESAIQFLSHDLFRAVQHYDISLIAYSGMYGLRSGDKVRVYSDGLNGRIKHIEI
jgi:hypothetical protein